MAVPEHPEAPEEVSQDEFDVDLTEDELQFLKDVPLPSDEQQKVIEAALKGNNVFLSGIPGSGKTFIVEFFKKSTKKKMFLTAISGSAASYLRGKTINSFAGIGLGEGSWDTIEEKILENETAVRNWKNCDILVIDEISMLKYKLLELLNEMAKRIRNSAAPFGGIQVIFIGDFLQLGPPTPKGKPIKYCFESPIWNLLNLKPFFLTDNHRQEDKEFAQKLLDIRHGIVDEEYLRSKGAPLIAKVPGIIPTTLFARNNEVSKFNTECLQKIKGYQYRFEAQDDTYCGDISLLKHNNFEKVLFLKENSQVILLKNMPSYNLVNGSRGIITKITQDIVEVKFQTSKTVPIRREESTVEDPLGVVLCKRTQFPLKLAYALSIHKSQGMSIDLLEIDLGSCFASGQGYTAITRARSPTGLRILNFNVYSFRFDPIVIEFQRKLEETIRKREEGEVSGKTISTTSLRSRKGNTTNSPVTPPHSETEPTPMKRRASDFKANNEIAEEDSDFPSIRKFIRNFYRKQS